MKTDVCEISLQGGCVLQFYDGELTEAQLGASSLNDNLLPKERLHHIASKLLGVYVVQFLSRAPISELSPTN